MMNSFKGYSLAVVAVLLLMLTASTGAYVNITGDITTTRTLGKTFPATDGIYVVTGDVNIINGATVTIEAGVQIRFDSTRSMNIGNSSGAVGTLICNGTSTEPIIMTANTVTPTRGYWYNLYFWGNSDASILHYTVIEYGGNTTVGRQVYLDNSNASFDNCTIRYSASYGLYAVGNSTPTLTYTTITHNNTYGARFSGTGSPIISYSTISLNTSYGIYFDTTGSPAIDNSTISTNTGYGVYCNANTVLLTCENTAFTNNAGVPLRHGANQIGFTSDNTFAGNTSNYIEILSATVAQDALWENHGIPYYVTGEIYIRGTWGEDFMTTVTIEPGTTMQFGVNSTIGLYIGHDTDPNQPGSLIAVGEALNRITFTRFGSSGTWTGIYFANHSHDFSCRLRYCTLSYGGYNRNPIQCNLANPKIEDTIVTNASSTGIYLVSSDNTMLIKGCEVSYNSGYGIQCNASYPVIQTTNVHHNTSYGIYCHGALGSPSISSCTINANSSYGIYCNDTNNGPIIANNTITNNGSWCIYIYGRFVHLITGNTISGNANTDIYVVADNITNDSSWEGQNVAYYMSGGFSIQGKSGADQVTTLTLQAGAVVKFPSQTQLYIGHDSDANYPGALYTLGTSTNPVKLTTTTVGPSPNSSYWWGVYWANYASDTLNECNYTYIEYGGQYNSTYGYHYPVHIYYSNPRFYNCVIRHSSYTGVYNESGTPTFTGCTIAENGWHNIWMNNCGNAILTNNIITDSSGGSGYYSIYLQNNCTPTITGNVIAYSAHHGLYCNNTNTAPIVNNNAFVGNNGYPILMYARNVWKIGTPLNIYAYNAPDQIHVWGDTVDLDSYWYNQMIPYYIAGQVTVQGKNGADLVTSLTLEPGVVLRFGSQVMMQIGHNTDANLPGALIAVGGTGPGQRITFQGNVGSPSPNYWWGIYFQNYSNDALCKMQYCDVRDAGYSNGTAIYVYQSSPTFRNTTISYTNGSGLYADNTSNPIVDACDISYSSSHGIVSNNVSNPVVTNSVMHHNSTYGVLTQNTSTITMTGCTMSYNSYGLYGNAAVDGATATNCIFNNNTNYPVRLYARQVKGVTGGSYTANATQKIYVVGDTIVTDSYWEAVIPYFMSGDVSIQGTDGVDTVTTLTLQEGAELRFGSQCGLFIGSTAVGSPGGLMAPGTASKMITFTADTTSPSRGYWDGLYFYNYANDALCQLTYCDIKWGGYSSNENVYCDIAAPTFTNCHISYGSGWNVYSYNGSNPTLINCEIDNADSGGVYMNTSANATLTGCNIHHNASNGVYLASTSNATITNCTVAYNNWGVYENASVDNATITGCTFNNNQNYPIRCYAGRVKNITNNTYTANSVQKIYVYGETITTDATWINAGIPYYIDPNAHLLVQGTDGADAVTTLTIQPGAEIQFQAVYLWIGHDSSSSLPGALVAVGTTAQPIKFTTYNTAAPAPGQWYGLYFATYCNTTITNLTNCIIEYGGSTGSYENVQCNNSSPVLTNCEIRYGEGYNVRALTNTANPRLVNCNVHHATSYGIYASPGAVTVQNSIVWMNSSGGFYIDRSSAGVPQTSITGTIIENNPYYGIYVTTSNSTPQISGCSIRNNNYSTSSGYGIYVTGSALPVISGSALNRNYFSGHITYGVYNATSSTCINATYNYWGKTGGPIDTFFGVDNCMNTGNVNPGAERVSDYVNYANWENVAPTATPTVTPTEVYSPTPTIAPTLPPTATPRPCINDGDVNNDHSMSSSDTQMTYMIVLGAYAPNYEESCSADCNGNGDVTIGDAQCMHIHILGQSCNCADNITLATRPTNEVKAERTNATALEAKKTIEASLEQLVQDNLIWIDEVTGCDEDTIEVNIHISNPNTPIDALLFDLDYPTDMLEYAGYSLDGLNPDWTMFGVSEPAAGSLRVAGFSYPGFIPSDSNGILVTLTFNVTCTECKIGDRGDIYFMSLSDDLAEWNGMSGSFTYCELQPANILPISDNKIILSGNEITQVRLVE